MAASQDGLEDKLCEFATFRFPEALVDNFGNKREVCRLCGLWTPFLEGRTHYYELHGRWRGFAPKGDARINTCVFDIGGNEDFHVPVCPGCAHKIKDKSYIKVLGYDFCISTVEPVN